MAYNEKLADRIRERLANVPDLEEKKMMGGLTFMVNQKMCIGIIKDEMMCRINPDFHETAVEMRGCRTMDFTKRPMKGFVMIDETGIRTNAELDFWVQLCLDYNKIAKVSKGKKQT